MSSDELACRPVKGPAGYVVLGSPNKFLGGLNSDRFIDVST